MAAYSPYSVPAATSSALYGADIDDLPTVNPLEAFGPPSASPKSVSEAVLPPATAALVQCTQQNKAFSWVVILMLVPLIPGFIFKMASLIFPQTDCTSISVSNPAQCLNDNASQRMFLYLTVFVLGFIGLIVAIALANSRSTSRLLVTSLALGSAVSILIAIWSNYDRMDGTLQLIIIGITIIAAVQIPRYINPCLRVI